MPVLSPEEIAVSYGASRVMAARAAVPDLATHDPVILSQRAGIEPDPWQADVLRTREEALLILASRQSGKSTTVATLAVHGALYEPKTLTLLLSPSQRQSGELFRKCMDVYRDVGRPVLSRSETALTLTLHNGSRIVSLPGKEETVRGYSGVRRIIIDEAARVADSLYFALRPMLAVSGGQLVALTTPWGQRGWFYEAWAGEGEDWKRIRVTAAECPRISPEFLEEERRGMPLWWYESEYECKFSDNANQVFPTELVSGLFSEDLAPLFGDEVSALGLADLEPLFEVRG